MVKRIFLVIIFFVAFEKSNSQTVEAIELLNVADGKSTSIKVCVGCKGVVVLFTSISCPYDHHYQDRIKSLIEKFGTSVSFYLVNSSPESSEDESKMKEALVKWGFSVPYLSDKAQTLMTALNAKRTPEAVLLKPTGKNLSIIYQGAIDDNPQVHTDTGKDFLKDAIEEVLSGKPIKVPTERVIGCSIRKKQ